MKSHQCSIEVILTNEDFLLGSDPEGCLESALDTNDDDFVGDKKDCEELSSKDPQTSDWKPIESDIKVTYSQCKNDKYLHLFSEMKFIQSKLKCARNIRLNFHSRHDDAHSQ